VFHKVFFFLPLTIVHNFALLVCLCCPIVHSHGTTTIATLLIYYEIVHFIEYPSPKFHIIVLHYIVYHFKSEITQHITAHHHTQQAYYASKTWL
jgi:hypothetical protein